MHLARSQLGGIAVAGTWMAAAVAGRSPAPVRPIVVIVSLDTVRADALGAYGGRAVTPHLDALAEKSVRFTHHFASAPTTLASHASLFTGRWPHSHGVPRNGFALDAANETLAEHLVAAGYEAAGFVGAEPLAGNTAISQGFTWWDDAMGFGRHDRPGAEVVDRALNWLDRRESADRPLLLFVHLYDAHAPYESPPGYLRAHGGPLPSSASDPGSIAHLSAIRADCPAGHGDARALERLYLSGVSWLDHEVGRLFAGLEGRGYLSDALVVVTADHGEAFDVHEECWDHGYTVYDETTRIPLLVRAPGLPAGVSDRLSANIDVFPTVLEWLALPPSEVEGVSFAPTLRGEDQARRGVVFSEATKPYTQDPPGWANAERRKSARTIAARLIWDPISDSRQLFVDPAEAVDRWNELGGTPTARALDLSLAGWVAQRPDTTALAIDDPATREALEALGYVEAD